MKILFLGDIELGEIVPAPSKVGYELFKRASNKYEYVRFYTYFQDGRQYSTVQKLFGKQFITKKITQMGLLTFILNVLKFRPQIVQIITPSVYYLIAFPIFKLMGTKIYYLVHNVNKFTIDRFTIINNYEKRRILLIEKLAVLYSSNILVLSEKEKYHLLDLYKIHQSKILIVDNGIKNLNIKKNYSIDSNTYRIITAGSLDRKEKGINFLIECLGKLEFSVELTICYYKAHNIKDCIIPPNIKIIWLEPLDDIELRKEFIRNDMFISLAKYEPFGIALLEAMNSGLLFLATDRIGLTEKFDKDLRQYVIPYGDCKIANEKLINLICLSIEEKQILSNRIINFSIQFTWDKVAEKYFNLYETN